MVRSAKKQIRFIRFVRGAAALLIAAAVNGAIFWALVGLNQPVDLTEPDQPTVRLVMLSTPQVKPPQPVEPPPAPQPPPQMMTVELDMDDPPPPTPQPLNMDLDLDLAVASVEPVYIPVVRQPVPVQPRPAPPVAFAPVALPITGPLDADHVDQPPRELSVEQPRYPRSALSLGREGLVKVRLLIDEQGEVQDAQVVQVQGHPAFRAAVLETARRWRFTPARDGGQPVAVWMNKDVTFGLEE